MTLDRKDYKSAIPQLEKRLSEVEKIGKDAFNKFEDIAHKTQIEVAEAEKKALALDYKMTTTRVQMEYQLQTTGLDPVEANWQTTMPSITYNSYQGKTLWYRSKTYVNDIVVQKTEPMTVNLMDGVYAFVNTVSGNTGWTTIDGDTIQTGKITSTNNLCYFDLDGDNFQLKDGYDLAHSDNALAWDGGLGTLYIKGDLELAKDGATYLKAWLESGVGKMRLGKSNAYNIVLEGDSIGFYYASQKRASISRDGLIIYVNGNPYTTFGDDSVSLADGAFTLDEFGNSYFSGDVNSNGDVYGNNIGAIKSKVGGTDYSTDYYISPSNQGVAKSIASISLPAGVWVVSYRAKFEAGTSDSFASTVNLSASQDNGSVYDRRQGTTMHQHNCSAILSPSSTTTYYLNGTSSLSGNWIRSAASALNITAVRIR